MKDCYWSDEIQVTVIRKKMRLKCKDLVLLRVLLLLLLLRVLLLLWHFGFLVLAFWAWWLIQMRSKIRSQTPGPGFGIIISYWILQFWSGIKELVCCSRITVDTFPSNSPSRLLPMKKLTIHCWLSRVVVCVNETSILGTQSHSPQPSSCWNNNK